MRATLIDQTADLMSEDALPVPVKADAWGLVDIEPDDILKEGQEAGLAVYIDLGAIGFEVSLTTDEVIKALARADSFKAEPDVDLVRAEPINECDPSVPASVCGCESDCMDVEDIY